MVHKTFEPETWTTFEVMTDHTCTDEDIERHFPLQNPKNSWNKDVYMCPDIDPQMELYGDFNAWSSSYLEIWVEKCNPQTSHVTCASEKEIEEFLKLKYLIIRMNTQSFSEMEMDYHIKNTTQEHWIPINYLTRLRNNYLIEYEEIEREDEYL
eukprot:CAMPEP_0176349640 /NCGR_PEP_ID=MMETSP0126-20121128/8836_1 /TAXON_ID=141414 ORGANISM="Strombidinopsis acuminatum, Strain SPMC142" /NCGR_SAMPLE_ID=MMETSP0126 /ASSEMBLY_ACC=CAM_ASM_000229 /LENGTH=152 /DNA_ID=CAMNT_0017699171 /DNA_START=450 /DNA_END=908 /DNA_ORIENTATION=-